MLIIQASNIHQGGGAVLLRELLFSLNKKKKSARVYVDSRFQFVAEDFELIEFVPVKPSLLARLRVEWLLFTQSLLKDKKLYLFFGNLPPMFFFGVKQRSAVILFFHNVILLDRFSNFSFCFSVKVKQQIERWWLKLTIHSISQVIVQSESVKSLFIAQFPNKSVVVLPFASLSKEPLNISQKSALEKKYDFIYVASSDPHKNHTNLLRAWLLLAKSGLRLRLVLTVSFFSDEQQQIINQILDFGGEVFNFSNLTHQEVMSYYSKSKALIFPSLVESFGLPLLEAQSLGLPILASELDYVRDIVSPEQTFDPNSPVSIKRAVERFLNIQQSCRTKILCADEFIDHLLAGKPSK